MNFRNYEINRRFVTNLKPKFKIEHSRVKDHKKRYTIGKKIENLLKFEYKMYILIVICTHRPSRVEKRGG